MIILYSKQVPKDDFPDYATSMTELQAPLDAIHTGVIEGRGAVTTALICETLLSMLPQRTAPQRVPHHTNRVWSDLQTQQDIS